MKRAQNPSNPPPPPPAKIPTPPLKISITSKNKLKIINEVANNLRIIKLFSLEKYFTDKFNYENKIATPTHPHEVLPK